MSNKALLLTSSKERHVGLLLAALGLFLFLGALPAEDEQFRHGVRAYKQQEYKQARTLLRSFFEQNPYYVSERRGSGAYWLGKAYEACNQPDSMRWAWRKGVEALTEVGRFDARLFDAHLWANWSKGGERERAIKAYTTLLQHLNESTSEEEDLILRRHVSQLLPLLSEHQRNRLFEGGFGKPPNEWSFREGGGAWLVAWWRQQDPVPSTVANERIEEHLERVREARSKFGYEERMAGWDERGDLYVRYGPPARRDSIPFTDARFHREVIRFGVGVHRGDFPKNEIWSYPQVGDRGHYLFVRRGGAYKLGQALDLIPPKLKRDFHAADRSQNRAYSAMAAFRYVYKHLAMHYQEISNAYGDIEAYFASQDMLENVLSIRGEEGSSVGSGTGERTVYSAPGPSRKRPGTVAKDVIQKSEHQQRVFLRKRQKEMPQQYSEASTTESSLAIQARTARFLTEKGKTRTEIFWGGSLKGETDSNQQVISVSLVQYNSNYERAKTRYENYVLEGEGQGTPFPNIAPEHIELTGSTDPFHLAIQWDRYEGGEGDEFSRLDDRTGRQVIRLDSLRPLSSASHKLEMSDLRPMVVTGQPQLVGDDPSKAATPYPFESLSPDASLLLYFEVYHLTYNPQEQARYEVEYEVERKVETSGFLGLFGGEETEQTKTSSSYTSSSRSTSESILLDWGKYSPEKPQPATVTVRITDEVTGQQVERSVDFRLRPSR